MGAGRAGPAGIEAAVADLLRTGLLLATGEDVIAGDIIGGNGTRRRPSDADWATQEALAEPDGPAYVSDPVTPAQRPDPVELPGGRFELTIGEPEQWVPGHPQHDAIRAHARRIFSSR
jgi:hypothetical protein